MVSGSLVMACVTSFLPGVEADHHECDVVLGGDEAVRDARRHEHNVARLEDLRDSAANRLAAEVALVFAADFGVVSSARSPRTAQIAARLSF